MSRERDVRQAVHDLLLATGEYHDIYYGGFETPRERPASDWRAAGVKPMSTEEAGFSDSAPTGMLAYNTKILVTFAVRFDDPQLRDEQVEHLLEVAKNAINGQSLGGLTNVQKTKFTSWHWLDSRDNERRIDAILSTQYYEEGWQAGDAGDP